jgi:GT2 family glycosyltransferase
MRLSVVTVTWNSKDFILKQIESVKRAAENIEIEQIIVDNASTDGTVEMIREKFPEVQVIVNKENKGFGAANNQGVLVSKGGYLLFLNPDMELSPGSLGTIIDWMDRNARVGIASPKLVDEYGNINEDALPRRFPRVWEQIALILKLPHIFPHLLDRYHMKGFEFDREQEVDSVRGSFMLMRRTLVEELGWAWDPRYFIWYEDVDICREARRLGYRVVHTPIITAVDHVGQSFKKRTTAWKQKQFTKSMLVYFRKWESWWKWVWIALFRPFGIFLAWLSEKIIRR